MADDKEQHRQSLKRILDQCTQHHKSKLDEVYLKAKNEQVKDVKNYLTNSLNLLTCAQQGIQSSQTTDNTRVSGLEYKINAIAPSKDIMNRLSEQSRKKHFHSIHLQRKSSSLRSDYTPPHSKRTDNNRTLVHDRLSLPTLMNKVKMAKKPANASKNSSLDLNDKKKTRMQDDHTYAQIRSQSRKIQQMRHMTVLGRVMGQNYKRHLKKLQERKKLFLRIKLHSEF